MGGKGPLFLPIALTDFSSDEPAPCILRIDLVVFKKNGQASAVPYQREVRFSLTAET